MEVKRLPITMYTTGWCSDCRRAKHFLEAHGVAYDVVDIEESPEAASLVIAHNGGRRRVPTLVIDGAYYGNPPLHELGKLLGV